MACECVCVCGGVVCVCVVCAQTAMLVRGRRVVIDIHVKISGGGAD